MSKKPNSSIKVAAMSLNMTVEQVEKLLDVNMYLSVANHEKRQIAEMYNKILAENETLEAEVKRLDDLCKQLMNQHSDISCENIMLRKAEVEKLRKEGEAMYPNLGPGWSHNAKEGKQS